MKLNRDTFKYALPKHVQKNVTDEFYDLVESIGKDPLIADQFEENIISYSDVLNSGRYKLTDYVNAVKFVSYKLLNKSDIDAYSAVFPKKYEELVMAGLTRGDIGAYVTSYTKGKMVIKILQQTVVPAYVLKAPMHFDAINELFNIGMKSRSDIARVQALSKVVDATKAPEDKKIQLELNIGKTDEIAELNKTMAEFAEKQSLAISNGMDPKIVAEMDIITAEVIEDE